MDRQQIKQKVVKFLCTTAMTGIWLVGPAAYAQVQSVSGVGDGSRSLVGDIVVTAKRREERAQDVPIVITAFSEDQLQRQGIAQAQNLQGTVPSLVVSNNGLPSREAQSFTIRGQGATF